MHTGRLVSYIVFQYCPGLNISSYRDMSKRCNKFTINTANVTTAAKCFPIWTVPYCMDTAIDNYKWVIIMCTENYNFKLYLNQSLKIIRSLQVHNNRVIYVCLSVLCAVGEPGDGGPWRQFVYTWYHVNCRRSEYSTIAYYCLH